MRILVALALASLVAACGGSSPPPAPVPPPPFRGAISPIGFRLQFATRNGVEIATTPVTADSDGTSHFDFLQCAPATQCSVNYVTAPVRISILGAASITLQFEITGDNPVFDYRTNLNNADPACGPGTPGRLSLYVQRYGDTLAYPYYRWFATPEAQDLAPGTYTVTARLEMSAWEPVKGAPDAGAFSGALGDLQAIGFVLGGGCFAGHGVAVTSGSARLHITGYSVQ